MEALHLAGVVLPDGELLREIALPLRCPTMVAFGGAGGFGQPIQLSCQNHGGSGMARVQQWDAAAGQWNLITEFTEPDQEVLQPLIEEDSARRERAAGC